MNYKEHFIAIGSAVILCAVFFAGYNRGFKKGAVRGVKSGADGMLLRIKELGYSIEKDSPIYLPQETNLNLDYGEQQGTK